jgi:hypothetical protein
MAGLPSWIAQDTLKRKERDGTASEMMKEGNIRRWKEIHQSSCPFFFSPARFYTREGVSYCHVLFFSGVIRPFITSLLVLHSPVALSTELFFYVSFRAPDSTFVSC